MITVPATILTSITNAFGIRKDALSYLSGGRVGLDGKRLGTGFEEIMPSLKKMKTRSSRKSKNGFSLFHNDSQIY